MLTTPTPRTAMRRAIIQAAPLAMRRPRSSGTAGLVALGVALGSIMSPKPPQRTLPQALAHGRLLPHQWP